MVECFQPATLNASSYCQRRRLHCAIDGLVEHGGLFLDHDAWEPAQHDFDLADLVPTFRRLPAPASARSASTIEPSVGAIGTLPASITAAPRG